MPTINITHEAREALRRESTTGELEEGTTFARPDGSWDIHVDSDTLERMDSVKQPGESYSDVILRVIATQKGTN